MTDQEARDRRAAEVLLDVFAADAPAPPGLDPRTWERSGRPLTAQEVEDVRGATDAAWAPAQAVHAAQAPILAAEAHVIAQELETLADRADAEGRHVDARRCRDAAATMHDLTATMRNAGAGPA